MFFLLENIELIELKLITKYIYKMDSDCDMGLTRFKSI
jgi:hypothetical protein